MDEFCKMFVGGFPQAIWQNTGTPKPSAIGRCVIAMCKHKGQDNNKLRKKQPKLDI